MSAVLLGEGADLEITLVELLVCGGVLRVGGVLLGEARVHGGDGILDLGIYAAAVAANIAAPRAHA